MDDSWLDDALQQERDADVPTLDRHLQRLRSSLFAAPAAPTTIGRYRIRSKLGAGGMGTVYAAHDPELDREVALKVVECRDEGARPQAMFEAQSLALLSHENVAKVFDVGETGATAVYIAMELVRGRDLEAWLSQTPRDHDEILAVLIGAGRGLAAAHAAGLVHRDFKPSNVVVGDDGVARVIDFGIAVSHGPVTSTEDPSGSTSARASASGFAGTPAYMAPEQRRGEVVDPRADQFSFCVVLYRAIVGRRPPRGLDKCAKPETRPPVEMPRRWWDAMVRGMQPAPADRFASMHELLAALQAARPRWGRRVLPVVGVVGITAFALVPSPPETPSCIDGLQDVWHDGARERVVAAFANASESMAPEGRAVAETLDRYAAQWEHARGQACASGSAQDPLTAYRDRAQRCLDRARTRLSTLVDTLLAAVDADALRSAQAAVDQLRPVDGCLDLADLLARTELSAVGPEQEAVYQQLEAAAALRDAGATEQSVLAVRDALALAEAQDDPRIVVVARVSLGLTLGEAAEYERSIETLSAAYFRADELGYPRLAGEAAAYLVTTTLRLGRLDEAEAWRRHASTQLERGIDDTNTAALVTFSEGLLRSAQGEHGPAIEAYRRAAEFLESEGESNELAMVMSNIAISQSALGEREAALETMRRGLEIRERNAGSHHPIIAASLGNIAAMELELGNDDEAELAATRSLTILDTVGAAARHLRHVPLTVLATLARRRGDHAAAADHLREALEGRPDPDQRALLLRSLGHDLLQLGETDLAAATLQQALDLMIENGASDDATAKMRASLDEARGSPTRSRTD